MHFTWQGRTFELIDQDDWLMPEVRQAEVWTGEGAWGVMSATAVECAISICREPGSTETIRNWLDHRTAKEVVALYREIEAQREAVARKAAEDDVLEGRLLSPSSAGQQSVSVSGDVEASPNGTTSSSNGGSRDSYVTESIPATGNA